MRSLQTWRFVTLLLAALGMTMGMAHLLEMPPKMRYDGALYATVNSTLYPLFAIVGGPIQVAAILAAAVLAYRTRGSGPAYRWAVGGTLGLLFSFLLWAVLVAPVNAEWARVAASDPAGVPAAYLALRDRWEFGHVAAFGVWLAGFCFLLRAAMGGGE